MRGRTLVLAGVVICLLATLGARPAAQAAEVRVVDLKGLEAALQKYRGQAVLLNFWAIWCEPCLAELPDLLAVGRDFRGKGGVVLTVSYDLMVPEVAYDEVLKEMRRFTAQRGIDVPVFIYEAEDYDQINERFGLPGPVPVTISLDRNGAVVERHAGKSTRDDFVKMMKKAIGSGGT
ncbi:MAG: TlpA family protein disulfide reductase [Acidobacteria bacterium]|nr:MAG: TlpA family protein disulfide reductase [Acidobacteriota bacterium]